MDSAQLVTPTLIGSLRVYRTEDGRVLSQQHLEDQPDRYRTLREIEAPLQLRFIA